MSEIASPCTNVCKIEPTTGWCEGCARSIDEIVAWKRADDQARLSILAALPPRRERLLQMGICTAAVPENGA